MLQISGRQRHWNDAAPVIAILGRGTLHRGNNIFYGPWLLRLIAGHHLYRWPALLTLAAQ
jgi:hypothetical protein